MYIWCIWTSHINKARNIQWSDGLLGLAQGKCQGKEIVIKIVTKACSASTPRKHRMNLGWNNLGKNADSKNAIFAPPWSMAWTNICITSISFKVIFGINNCIQYKVFLWTICKTDGDWFLRKTGEFAGSCHLSKVPKAWTEDWKEIWMYNLFEFKSGNQIFSPGGQHSFWSACS